MKLIYVFTQDKIELGEGGLLNWNAEHGHYVFAKL